MGVYIPYTRLPSAYQEVEWIGTKSYPQQGQYIDTGVAVSSDLSFDMKISVDTSYTTNKCIVGTAWTTSAIFLYVYNSHYRLHYGGSTIDGASISSSDTIISVTPNSLTVNGSTVTASPGSSYASGNVKLYRAQSSDPYSQLGVYNVYYFKLKKNGTLIRDFVPCYRKSDGVIGLYDLVNDQFYTNAGAGTFSKGNDVNMSELKNAYIGEVWTPGTNTVLYVPMETDLTDNSSNHFTLTNTGVSLVSGKADIDVGYFNGSSYLSGANDALFNFGDMHISAWINLTTTNDAQFIFAGISSGNIFFGIQRGGVGIGRNGVAWDNGPAAANISINNWHYISLDRIGTSITISLDLVNKISGTNSRTYTTSGGYQIGNDGASNRVNGYMSNLIIENKGWTSTEKSNYYNLTKSTYGL